MNQAELAEQVQTLSEENQKMKATLKEIEQAISPFIERRKHSGSRTFEQQLLHDVRNILNELGLLRALVPGDEPGNG